MGPARRARQGAGHLPSCDRRSQPARELLRVHRAAGVGERARRAVSRADPCGSRARARPVARASRRGSAGARHRRLARRHGGARVGTAVPVPVDRLVVFAAPAATSAQAIAWNTVQRMAIEADPAWRRGRYLPAGPDGGAGGGARAGDDHLPLRDRVRGAIRARILTRPPAGSTWITTCGARATSWWPGSTPRATSR